MDTDALAQLDRTHLWHPFTQQRGWEREAPVMIERGENRGKTLSYYHPIKELTPIGMWEGDAMTLRLPLKDLKTMGGDCLVALLQVENDGPILGAAQYERAPAS